MPLISQHFNLGKAQAELDFVDADVAGDVPLFVDPFAISQRPDPFSQDCHLTLITFFERVVYALRNNDGQRAKHLLGFLGEPNETRLGLSSGRPRGAGIGRTQSEQLFNALAGSTAVQTGFLKSLEECELMIDGIAHDKISDLTTNIIRAHLARYTRDQCQLLGIPYRRTALPPYYDPQRDDWVSDYFDIPVVGRVPLLLVPKVLVRLSPAYDHRDYYKDYVLEYLQAENLDANSSLVHALKNGRRVVYKRELKEEFPLTKQFLFEFSKAHPTVLQRYRRDLIENEQHTRGVNAIPDDAPTIASMLIDALRSIPAGGDTASEYHKLMIGVVEILFYPHLLYPQKEGEIHDGRKRIDIIMENGATEGFFRRITTPQSLPATYVVFECKNYGSDVGNPEIDQLTGRFSPLRGKLGFLCCRRFENRSLFVNRCRDAFRDDRGLALPLDDDTVILWLGLIAKGARRALDLEFAKLADEVRLT